MTDPFGWDYPAGAENDPRAPYNDPGDPPCEACGMAGCCCPRCRVCDWPFPAEQIVDGVCLECQEDGDARRNS